MSPDRENKPGIQKVPVAWSSRGKPIRWKRVKTYGSNFEPPQPVWFEDLSVESPSSPEQEDNSHIRLSHPDPD
jgi:hypothetical protein